MSREATERRQRMVQRLSIDQAGAGADAVRTASNARPEQEARDAQLDGVSHRVSTNRGRR